MKEHVRHIHTKHENKTGRYVTLQPIELTTSTQQPYVSITK